MGKQKVALLFNKIPNNLVTIIMLKMCQEIIYIEREIHEVFLFIVYSGVNKNSFFLSGDTVGHCRTNSK